MAIGLVVAAAPAAAREWHGWCGDPGSAPSLGWHFYCDRAAPVKPVEPSEAETLLPPAEPSATEEIARMRHELEESRATAILEPTPENVAAYLYLQQVSLQRASTFSDVFRRVVWSTPELDYTLTRPAGALAKQLWSDDRLAAQQAVLANLGERYGLIYLGDSHCAGCRVFGPLLRAFALRHGLDVLAVSMTGEALEGWPEAVPDNGRAAQLGLVGAPVPAVVLFDTETGEVLPVAFGVVAEDQLAERIYALTALEVGNDY
ncbi:conjugal transfer protein TraF [Candidatus Rariloculus sp.]|uniref:conjugal transfer protein TraF n=1 Tax=Candidatus Rariloculus sp. TaxID=3101265 RepID=UPI003D0BC1C9